jgi:hypothetical protein
MFHTPKEACMTNGSRRLTTLWPRYRLVALTATIVGIAVVVILWPYPTVRDDCPHDWQLVVPGLPPSGEFGLVGALTDIPEFHDCQAMILEGPWWQFFRKPYYGPTIGVFLSQANGSLVADLIHATYSPVALDCPPGPVIDPIHITDSLAVGIARNRFADTLGIRTDASPQVASCTPTYPAVAIGDPPPSGAQRKGEVTAIATLQLYNFGPGDYKPLNIKPGFNCVYYTLSTANQYEAWMFHTHPDTECKVKTRAQLLAGGFPLQVKSEANFGNDSLTYPPAARWDWDPNGRNQYMGFRCGAAWCDVGRPGFSVSARHDAGFSASEKKLFGIPGWYDEQRLAIWKNNASGNPEIVLGDIKGVIVPYPHLHTLTLNSFTAAMSADVTGRGGWIDTWRVYLEADDMRYKQRFGFTAAWPVAPSRRANIISLRMKADGQFEARITPADGGKPKIKTVTRVDHAAIIGQFAIPGTVRWRWLANALGGDETNWGKCDYGCCRIDP